MGEIIGTDSVIITGIGFPMSTDSTEVYDSDSPQPVNALDAAVEAGAEGLRVERQYATVTAVERNGARAVLQAALDAGAIHLDGEAPPAVVTVTTLRARVAELEQEVARLRRSLELRPVRYVYVPEGECLP